MKSRTLAIITLILGLAAGVISPAWAPDAFSEGLELFNAGKWPQAADRLAAAAKKSPNDISVRLTAGVALANVKRYDAALDQFDAASRLSLDGILPYLLLDGTYSEIGDAARSRQARDQATRILNSGRAFGRPTSSDRTLLESLAKHPSNAIAHCLLGNLYQLQNKLPLAKERYAKASELAPRWAKPVFNLGLADLRSDPRSAEQSFDRALKMDPSNSRIYLWQGDAYLQQGKYDEAISAYSNAARDRQLMSEANTRIGNAQLRAGNLSAATQQFRLAAKQAPEDARPLAGEAQVYLNEGKLKEAETKYSQAAQVMASNQAPPPSQAVVQQQIAVVRQRQGKVDEAIESLKLGHELHPTFDNARGLARMQQGAGRLQAGIAQAEAELKEKPKSKPTLMYLLSAYSASENWAGVIDVASRLAKLDPPNARTCYEEAGAAQMRLGNVSGAVEAYASAINAGNASTWPDTARHAKLSGALPALEDRCASTFKAKNTRSVGIVLFELRSARGDTAGMVEIADRLVKLFPDDAAIWLRLGQAHEQAGNKELARIAYARAAAGSDPEAAAAARVRAEQVEK